MGRIFRSVNKKSEGKKLSPREFEKKLVNSYWDLPRFTVF